MPTQTMNMSVRFHWNPYVKYRNNASRETGVNGTTDCQSNNRKTKCLRRLLLAKMTTYTNRRWVRLNYGTEQHTDTALLQWAAI